MVMIYLFESKKDTSHKVFLSYYHKEDEYYKKRFEELFVHLFINKSVRSGDIDTDVSTEYIKRVIQQNYISDTSIIVVLVGPKTYCRKHVDWEISAALMKKAGGYSGLLELCLPNHPDHGKNKFDPTIVPQRLVDNCETKYAKFYDWTEDESEIKERIEDAFNARMEKSDLIDNSRLQFKHNRCE